MADLTRMLEKLVPDAGGEDTARMRTGEVDAVNTDGTLDLTLSGVLVPDVPRLEGVLVAAGDVVQVISYRGSLLVIGRVAADTGIAVVRLVQVATQSIPSNSSTALTFGVGSTSIDTDNYHDETVQNTRITPTRPGIYMFKGTYVSSATATMTRQYTAVAKNGSQEQPVAPLPRDATNQVSGVLVSALLTCNGTGDYFELMANQIDSGGAARNTQASGGVNSVFEMWYVRPLPAS